MESLNDTHDQRVRNIQHALYMWVGNLRDSGIKDLNPDFRPSGIWPDEGDEPVETTDDVASLLSVAMYRLSQPGINLDSWLIYGEDFDAPDLLVIDVEGVVLGLHIEEDRDNANVPYTLHVRVLDHLPDVKVSCGLGAGDVSISVSDYMWMWWTLENPTRGQVRVALHNLLTVARHFRGALRVERMRRVDVALAAQGMTSVHAHNYRDLMDWLTPMVGYDRDGEQWECGKYLTTTNRDDPENYRTEYTWSLTHEDVSGELEIRITNHEKRREIFPVTMTVIDKRGKLSTTDAPTHADIVAAIVNWVQRNHKEGHAK